MRRVTPDDALFDEALDKELGERPFAGRLGTAAPPEPAPEPPAGPKIKPENSAHMAQIVLESAQPIPGEDPVRLLGAHPDSDSHKPSK